MEIQRAARGNSGVLRQGPGIENLNDFVLSMCQKDIAAVIADTSCISLRLCQVEKSGAFPETCSKLC